MLTRFAVKNYRGFSKRLEWDLSHPSNYNFNQSAIKDGIVKNGIVYGPNGSGKTNLSMAIFDIVFHMTQKYKKGDYYHNYVYADSPNGIVEFEYDFRFDNHDLSYAYFKDHEGRLVKETLVVDGTTVFDHSKDGLTIDPELFPLENSFKENIINNDNHVSIVNVLLSSLPLLSGHFLLKLRDFVNGMLWFRNVDRREFIGLENNNGNIDEYIIKNHLVEDFKDFLKSISGQEFEFANHDDGDKVLVCLYDGNKMPFNTIASTGTQGLMLLYYWVKKMDKANFVFIDEFDAFYHFDLAYAVCQLLFNLDCQAFVSTHNTYLMTNDLLRPDCNFLLASNCIKPLCDCTDKELRLGHNMEKLYRANAFQI